MRVRLLAVLGALALATLGGAQRAALPATTPDFPLEELTPGLTGYALTAGAGNVIERFEVEVLGLQQDAGTGFPLVLIRASGPFIERVGGIAAGMSGSPVYLPLAGADALLGAIGYVFPDADHSVALVTPIDAMRDDRLAGRPPAQLEVAGYGAAVPVATPVLLSGAGARAASLLAPLFDDVRLTPFPTQLGSAASTDAAFSLEPGAAVAVRLMSGDLELSAIGTLTTVEGASGAAARARADRDGAAGAGGPDAAAGAEPESAAGAEPGAATGPGPDTISGAGPAGHTFLAFGHPFLGTGEASYALSPAHVLEIVASDSVPFKLANAGREVIGAVELDTPTALHGTLGAAARTVPLTITVTAGGRQERFDVELAAAERLFPTLGALAALQASDRILRAVGGGHAALAWEIEFEGGGRLNVLEQASSPSDIAFAAAVLAGGPLAVLAQNQFAEPHVSAVALSLELSRDQNSATVADLVLEDQPLTAGGHAVLHVRLQPYRREALVRTFSVPLPDDLTGELTLLVRGGDVPRELDGVPEEGGEVDEPRSFPELLDALRQQLQASELVVEAIDGRGDVRRLLRVALPYVVLGSEELSLTVAPAGGAGTEVDDDGEE